MSIIDTLCMAIAGQPSIIVYHQLQAVYYNLISWLLVLLGMRNPSLRLQSNGNPGAILVLSPGGHERCRIEPLDGEHVMTVGYNLSDSIIQRLPTSRSLARLAGGIVPADHVVVSIKCFSVNCESWRWRRAPSPLPALPSSGPPTALLPHAGIVLVLSSATLLSLPVCSRRRHHHPLGPL